MQCDLTISTPDVNVACTTPAGCGVSIERYSGATVSTTATGSETIPTGEVKVDSTVAFSAGFKASCTTHQTLAFVESNEFTITVNPVPCASDYSGLTLGLDQRTDVGSANAKFDYDGIVEVLTRDTCFTGSAWNHQGTDGSLLSFSSYNSIPNDQNLHKKYFFNVFVIFSDGATQTIPNLTLDVECSLAAGTKSGIFDSGSTVNLLMNAGTTGVYTYPEPSFDLSYCSAV